MSRRFHNFPPLNGLPREKTMDKKDHQKKKSTEAEALREAASLLEDEAVERVPNAARRG